MVSFEVYLRGVTAKYCNVGVLDTENSRGREQQELDEIS